MEYTPPDLDLKTMQQVSTCGYEPIERRGKGTYGYVYEVADEDGEPFAFKYILPDPQYQNEGLDSLIEIDTLSRVNHPHIIHAKRLITVHDCQIDGLAIVLPLADRTLYDLIKDPLLSTSVKLPILYKLAKALEFMHASNILHLDIKGQNVVLQSNTPYFIDFGLSMLVDNATIGQDNYRTRVTIDHRPPEILAGGRRYNAAVDVWSFGIMMLYLLSGTNIFYQVNFGTATPNTFLPFVLNYFNDPNTISDLLIGMSPKYRPLCVDLLSRILRIRPSERLTATEICQHPLFDTFRSQIDGFLDGPPTYFDYAPDHRNILKLLIFWTQHLLPSSRAELLFLAVDLFNRTGSFYKDKSPLQRMSLAATCVFMASKLTSSAPISLKDYTTQIANTVTGITPEMILADEINVIHLLSGVLNVSKLYNACSNGDELKLTFIHVILSRDSTLYAMTDIPAWVNVMKQNIITPIYPDRNITIQQLIE